MAAEYGSTDGEWGRIGKQRGSLRLHARGATGTLVVESQWPASAFIEGHGINTLVGAEPSFSGAGSAYHGTAGCLRASGTP